MSASAAASAGVCVDDPQLTETAAANNADRNSADIALNRASTWQEGQSPWHTGCR